MFDKQNLERQVFRDTIEENNRQLDVANRELEARVARRTSELKTEMEGHKQAKLELERAQLQLVQAEKMSSLGELVAGVAHEINNPVNFVQNNHQVAKDAVGEIEQTLHAIIPNEGEGQRVWDLLQPSLNVIEESSKNHLIGTERISKIVNSLLAFSRHDEADIKEANINALIDETLVIINNQAKKVELVKNYSELPLLNCKGSQLSQVFMNLLTNAIYAAERGDNPPKVTIETSVKETILPLQSVIMDTASPPRLPRPSSTRLLRQNRLVKGPAWAWPFATRLFRNITERLRSAMPSRARVLTLTCPNWD